MRLFPLACLYLGLLCFGVLSFNCIFIPFSDPSIYQETLAFIGGGIFVLGAYALPRSQLLLPFNTVFFLLLALLVAGQSHYFRYAYAAQPLFGVVYFLWAALLSWAAWQWREQLGAERFYRQVAMALLAGSLLAGLIGLLAFLSGGEAGSPFSAFGFYEGGEMKGPLRQRNLYTTLLLSGLVCLAWLLGQVRGRWSWLAGLGLLLVVPMGVTGSRTGLLVIIVFTVLAGMTLLIPAARKHSVFGSNLLFLAVLALAGQFLVPLLSHLMGGESVSVVARSMGEGGGAESTRLRFEAWQRAWQMFMAHPGLGVGFNNLASTDFWLRAGPAAAHLQTSTFYTHCHNLFLQIFAEMGLAGGILLLALCWQTALGLIRSWREPFGLFCIAVLVPMAVHSLLEFPLWYAFFLGPWLLLGQGASAWSLDARYLRSFRLLTLMFVAGLAFFGWNMVSGIRAMDQVANLLAKDDKIGAYQQSWTLAQSNGLVAPYAERAIAMLVLPGDNAAENQQALQLVERIMGWKPYPLAPYKLAIWLMVTGEEARAIAMLKAAVTVYPDEAIGFIGFLDQMTTPGLIEKREKLRAAFELMRSAH